MCQKQSISREREQRGKIDLHFFIGENEESKKKNSRSIDNLRGIEKSAKPEGFSFSPCRLSSANPPLSVVNMQRPPVRTGSGSRVSALASEFRRATTLNNASSSRDDRSRPSSRSRSRPSRSATPSAVPSRSTTPLSKVETVEDEDEELLGEFFFFFFFLNRN